MRCLRQNGSLRRFWYSRSDAEKFVASHPDYFGDIVVLCSQCGAFHADRPWAPSSAKLEDDPLRCAICTELANNSTALIQPDGLIVHEACARVSVN
jgi:hypothetical protein